MKEPDPYIGRGIENGKYQILQKIGAGGMGAVYKASQPKMGRMVAIKVLHSKLVARKDLVSRFSREAKALGHLTHPNTVKIHDDGVLEDGSLYIVMEHLEGKNLNQTVRSQGPFSLDRALPIMTQVCGALDEAHRAGIVHRDLKPENIFLCNNASMKDFPKVLDFGLAKVTEKEMRPGSIILTQEGMVFGTPEFMSPEQAQGMTLDARSDIYSLAVILYEVLTGKLPFDARLPMEHIQHHVMTQPIPIDQRVPGLHFPPGFGEVLARALAKNPAQRYQTSVEFAAALVASCQRPENVAPPAPSGAPGSGYGMPGTPVPPAAQLGGPQPPHAPPGSMASGPTSDLRPAGVSNVGLIVAVAVGFLVLGIGLAVVVMKFVLA
jgi:eukaryotic-like serine/threonine-protein kinase